MLSRRGGQVAMPGANQTTTTYGYETDSDLASLIHNYPGSTPDLVYAHTYSASGRLLTTTTSEVLNRYVVPDAPGTQSYAAANPLNQYPSVTPIGGSAVALSYDLNGNLTGDGASTYTYDATNKLVSITGLVNASYGYDALDRRMSKTSSGVTTRFLHAGSDEIAEYSSAGALLRRYVPGPGVDERAVLVDSGALSPPATALRFPHTDRVGSVVAVTSNTGAVSERFTYDGFGRSTSPMSGYPFRFTGQRLDSETGLMFYKARVYSQALGRFLQTDPIGTKDDLNLYAYVGNDPVNSSDPTGTKRGYADGYRSYFSYASEKWSDQQWAAYRQRLERQEAFVAGTASLLADFTPIVGDGKGFYDAYRDGTPLAWGTAIISIVPGLDIVKYGDEAIEGATAALRALPAPKMVKHHIFAQEFRPFFKNAGIDIDDYTVQIGKTMHGRGIHGNGLGDIPGGWNDRWREFIRDNPNATAKDIYQFGGRLMDEYQLSGLDLLPY